MKVRGSGKLCFPLRRMIKNDEHTRFVAVLEIPPVVSAETAVRV
jgi:hypothetical protein